MHVPSATYRIQFNPDFGFESARKQIAYLHSLGISDLYASPIFRARKGSQHGYDVVDPNRLNPELGTEEDFDRLVREVQQHNMGWLQDVVPNHMAFDYENEFLIDVLENGPNSQFFKFFDIDWEHAYENIKGRVLAPFLGRFYGESLEDGEIALHYGPGGLTIRYYEMAFPVRIASYALVFSHRLAVLKKILGPDNSDFITLLGVLYVLRAFSSDEEMVDRYDQITFIKRILWELYSRNEDMRAFVDDNVRAFNGEKGNPDSFVLLDTLLSDQYFRLSFWKVATKEINYRRFFTINGLISLNMHEDDVFNHTHDLAFRLLDRGKITGLRIDHIDGLSDPEAYLKRLRRRVPDSYVVIEKILEHKESLPRSLPVHGTTGYDFMNYVNGLLCDKRHERAFSRIYANFTGLRTDFEQLVREKKRLMVMEHMAGDVNNLAQMMKTVSSRDRHASDVTMYGLRRALMEVLDAFPVYRTYVSRDDMTPEDSAYLKEAVDIALETNPALEHELTFVRRFLLLQFPPYLDEAGRKDWVDFVKRFQQLTGPLMAKGYEDTVLYIYNRLISLNEVGGAPDRFGCTVDEFHRFNLQRQCLWPDTMNATATHDTKRGEDVRARINVLSEIPQEWDRTVKYWARLNREKKRLVKGVRYPDKNDEYFVYQTLIGAYPFQESLHEEFVQRMCDYVIKAVREAKIHTAWIKPDAEYEDAYIRFLTAILEPSPDNLFFQDFLSFQKKIARFGVFNALSQTLLKIAAPGVPDFYQGTEVWDLNLVDPDNRRPVPYDSTMHVFLEQLQRRTAENVGDLISELLAAPQDGKIKLFLIYRALNARREHGDLFRYGTYVPLKAAGPLAHHVVAFARKHPDGWMLAVIPRFLTYLLQEAEAPLGEKVWSGTHVVMPSGCPRSWYNVLTDRTVSVGSSFPVGNALEHFPVGLFISDLNRDR